MFLSGWRYASNGETVKHDKLSILVRNAVAYWFGKFFLPSLGPGYAVGGKREKKIGMFGRAWRHAFDAENPPSSN